MACTTGQTAWRYYSTSQTRVVDSRLLLRIALQSLEMPCACSSGSTWTPNLTLLIAQHMVSQLWSFFSALWFECPAFLSEPETEWPQQDTDLTKLPDNDVEVKKIVTITTKKPISPINRLLKHYSDRTRLKRAVAWILVWMKHLQDKVAASKKLEQESVKPELEQQDLLIDQ